MRSLRARRLRMPAWVPSRIKRLFPRAGRTQHPGPAVGRTGEPTFGYLVTHRKRWLFETLPLAAAEYHYDIFTKSSQRRLAEELGLSVTNLYAGDVSLDEAFDYVERNGLDRFVLKPDSSHNAIGFRALVREAGGFRDIVKRGRPRSVAALKRRLRRELEAHGRPDVWVLEELLLPPDGELRPIDDYKFFCFGGRTELILWAGKVPRAPWDPRAPRKVRNWYTRDWMPAHVSVRGPNRLSPRAPRNGAALLAVAEEATAQLCYPFIRMDLYDTSRGVVFGEFTPGPGARSQYLPDWDEHLSRRWREEAAKIEEGIRSGRIWPRGATTSSADRPPDDPGVRATSPET